MTRIPYVKQPGDVACPTCGLGFASENNLRVHAALVHQAGSEMPPVTCHRCGRDFSWAGVSAHLRACDGRTPIATLDPETVIEDVQSHDSTSWWVRYAFKDLGEDGRIELQLRAGKELARIVHVFGRRTTVLVHGDIRHCAYEFNHVSTTPADTTSE